MKGRRRDSPILRLLQFDSFDWPSRRSASQLLLEMRKWWRIPKWNPILDPIPEAAPVHLGGHVLLRWAELCERAVHWDEVGRWVLFSFAEKVEHFWMCEDC